MPSTDITPEQKKQALALGASFKTGDARVAGEAVYTLLLEQQGASFDKAMRASKAVGQALDSDTPSWLVPALAAAAAGFLAGRYLKA